MTIITRPRTFAALLGAVLLTIGLAPATTADGANAAPVIQWQDQDLWVVHHYLGKTSFGVTACDPESALDTLYFNVPGFGRTGFTGMPDGTQCHTLGSNLVIDQSDSRAHRNYTGTVTAMDAEGNRADQRVFIRFGMLPLQTNSIVGLPDFQTLPALKAYPAKVDLRLTPEGTVRNYKLTWDGKVQADTMTGAALVPGDSRVQITVATGNVKSTVQVGADVLVESYFVHAGGPWWNLEPLVPNTYEAQQSVKDIVFGPYP